MPGIEWLPCGEAAEDVARNGHECGEYRQDIHTHLEGPLCSRMTECQTDEDVPGCIHGSCWNAYYASECYACIFVDAPEDAVILYEH